MGKHDIRDNMIAKSSEEFLKNKLRLVEKEKEELESKLAFAAESNAKLIKENSKWQKWFKEHDTAAQDRIAELEAEIELLNDKIAKLVKLYV